MRIVFALLLFFIYFYKDSVAQSVKENITFIEKHTFCLDAKDNNYRESNQLNNKEKIKIKHSDVLSKYNPIALLAVYSMLFYQKVISPQYYSKCIYQLSCSNFSKAAIKEFGMIKGVFLSADRLMRCNTNAINDIPASDFDPEGYAIDEPSKYHICK